MKLIEIQELMKDLGDESLEFMTNEELINAVLKLQKAVKTLCSEPIGLDETLNRMELMGLFKVVIPESWIIDEDEDEE